MKLQPHILPVDPESAYDKQLNRKLLDFFRVLIEKVNGVSSGAYRALDNAYTAAPTTGTWVQGDKITNSNPTELGSAGSKYVIQGWVCTVSGTPGTWLQIRTLTGN